MTLNRKSEVVAKRLISQSEVDAARTARDSAQAELASAHEEFTKLTAGARIEDIEQAKAELAVAQANVTLQQQNSMNLLSLPPAMAFSIVSLTILVNA